MGAEISPARPIPVLWQIGEGHAVVGQHGVDCIGECLDDATEELGPIHLAGVIAELDVGELGHPVDRQKHVELALGRAPLADVDMDVPDRGCGELAPLGVMAWRSRPAPGRCGGIASARARLGIAVPAAP